MKSRKKASFRLCRDGEAVAGEGRRARYLYPRYWQVKTESREVQVSTQAVRRSAPTRNWRRLEPSTCKETKRCRRKCACRRAQKPS